MGQQAIDSETTARQLDLDALRELSHRPEVAPARTLDLLETLRSDDEESRAWANDCLQLVDRPPLNIAPRLAASTCDACVPVAAWACTLLGRLSEHAVPWLPTLVTALRESDALAVRQQAALALGRIPAQDAAVLAALQAASGDPDQRLSRLASQALAKLQG